MARICPHCGYEGTEERCPNDELPTIDPEVFELSEEAPALTGTVLVDRYRIEEQLQWRDVLGVHAMVALHRGHVPYDGRS